MVMILFYEKPGCKSNKRQKKLLETSGHVVVSKSISNNTWTMTNLKPFFIGLPLREWFNKNAPEIKSGKIKPEKLLPDQAIALMVNKPLLIRRPLMQVEQERMVGFENERVDRWIGLSDKPKSNLESCTRSKSMFSPTH